MATVQLDRRGWEDGDLPDVCMLCGGHAPDRVHRIFVWQPAWVLSNEKKRTALVPMCSEHRNHWRTRTLFAWGVFVSAVVLGVMGVMAVKALSPDAPITVIYGIVVFALIAPIVVVIVIQWGTIRPMEIAERSLTLRNVSPEFVEAYEKSLDEEESRGKRKFQLSQVARQRWNESPASPEPGDRSRSIREDHIEADLPPRNDNIRPG